MRNNQVLAMANSSDTPTGRCSSPTINQFQIFSKTSFAAVSKRLGSRGGRCCSARYSGASGAIHLVQGDGSSAGFPIAAAAAGSATTSDTTTGSTGTAAMGGATTSGTDGAGFSSGLGPAAASVGFAGPIFSITCFTNRSEKKTAEHQDRLPI